MHLYLCTHGRKLLFALTILLFSTAAGAQQASAVGNDAPANTKAPSKNIETVLTSHQSRIMGMLMLAAGGELHGTVLLLHGFPGYEQNMDLAQALRRDGWNVLAMHYRGSWGSEGSFSFTHCMEDVGAMLAYVAGPSNAAKFHVDPRRIVVIGHSMGGFLALAAAAQHPEVAGVVVLTEGSPVHDAAGYFGGELDPADYAPLAGASPSALKQDAEANSAAWDFKALAAKAAPRPFLVISANDGLRASNEALTAELKRAGSPVTYLHMDTDHGFSDHRIALQSAVLQWLEHTMQ